jgi:asparagine synthase (glutamine-hydrolysing)
MCGITGWASFGRVVSDPPGVLAAMTATMSRRGPDDHGLWLAEHAALGHRRLAVIDLVGGAQPLVESTPRGPVTLTFSGEIYNFVDLRAQLRALGHRFRTRCDTEVLLRGYLQWGAAVAERLNGMFAFAVWDGRDEHLLLVRDRLGIKPLYYAPIAGGVLFGSEPKAIFAHPLGRRVLDLEGLRELVAHTLSLDQPVWSGVREVPPGTVLIVARSGIRQGTYWRLEAREHRDGLRVTVGTIRHLLEDTVRRQLVADVPLCILLSGGLDSSTLSALSARSLARSGETVHSYAVDFVEHAQSFAPDDERPTRDAPYVRTMVSHLGAVHNDVMLDPDELAEPKLRERVVTAFDLPPGSQDRDRSMYLLFREIRRQSTVALSGESADEIFCGYEWFHAPAVQKASMFPWIAGLSGYGQLRHLIRPELRVAIDIDSYLADLYSTAAREVDALPGEDPFEHQMRVACHLHLTRQLRVLLARKDRLSMAVGLEVRVPYCDHRLVEYVYNVPWAMKTFDGREKSLLRAAAVDVLPPTIAARVKSAYPSYQDARHIEALQRQVRQLAAQPRHPVFDLIDRPRLHQLVDPDAATLSRAARNGLEDVLNTATWLELYRPEVRV